MNVLKNTNIYKKIFLFMLIIIMVNVFYPLSSNASELGGKMMVGVGNLFYGIEDGILKIINSIFVDKDLLGEEGISDDTIYLSPETIIKGKFALMNANIFEEVKNDGTYYDISGDASSIITGKNALRNTISGWYYALRNLAIVALLSILVYVGIRMTISTVSQDKAKYKTMLKDWFVALCLVFVMHYIMVGILNISSTITNAIGTTGSSVNMSEDISERIEERIDTADKEVESWGTNDAYVSEVMWEAYGYLFVYAAIIVFTVIFTVKYIIRAITIVFLVLIAPITCVTYPIDKIKDGKSQAFDFWFREFFFQVIIQPFHLLIYVVLIGSATELASSNIIYAILCYAMMLPAEKIIKQMFGINDKLGSPLGAFASGAVANNLLNKATQAINSRNSKHNSTSGGSSNDEENNLPPRTKEGSNLGSYEDNNISDSSETNNNNSNSENMQGINQQQNNNISDGSETDSNDNNQGIDYERAAAFSNYREQGISQDEAEARVNEELPWDRNNSSLNEGDNNVGNNDTRQHEQINAQQQDTQNDRVNNQPNDTQNNQIRQADIKEPSRARKVGRALKNQAARDIRKKYGTTKGKKVAGKIALRNS